MEHTSPTDVADDRHFSRRVMRWFILAVVLLLGIAAACYQTMGEMLSRNQWVSHTYDVLGTLDDTLSQLKDVQAASRGYAITGEEPYLIPLDNALPQIRQNMTHLQQLTTDNPSQQARLVRLHGPIEDRIARAQDVVKSMRDEGQAKAFALIRDGKGTRAMGEVRNIVQEMQQAERLLLVARQQSSLRAAESLLLVGGVALVACLLILSLVFWMIRNEGRRRAESERSLKHAVREMHEITEETKLVGRIGDFLQSCHTTEEAFAVLAENLPRLLPGMGGDIGLLNNSRNLIEVAHCWSATGAQESSACQLDFVSEECWALRRGRSHFVLPEAPAPHCQHLRAPLPTTLCFPLVAHGETLGLLSLTSPEPHSFSENKLNAAKSIAEQASLTLANLRLQQVLRTQSTQDSLTGLFNRRYMEATLERETARAMRQSQPLSVVMFDVDHFKHFNDLYGHEAGDAVLAEIGRMMRRLSRTEDIACRYGGEEFVLILPGASLEIAAGRAQALGKACRELQLQHHNQHLGQITLSLGVASFPEHGERYDAVISTADGALYEAKLQGRDRVVIANRNYLPRTNRQSAS